MTLDPQKLLSFSIPSVRQNIVAKHLALYALSIGLGHDPTDEKQLDFVDEARGLRIVPSAALVLAHPGFWLGDPRSGVDPAAVLHGEQSFEISAAIPTRGTLESRTVITGLVDKGPGKPALLYTETTLHAEEDIIVARLNRTTFIRGGGGFGGEGGPVRTLDPVPERSADHIVDLPTRPEQALLYRLNGDLNPLHSDPRFAARAGFERPILHGLCTMGFICHALLRARADYDEQRLQSMALRFSGPVYPGETIRTEVWDAGNFRATVVERDVVVADNGFAVIAPLPTTGRKS